MVRITVVIKTSLKTFLFMKQNKRWLTFLDGAVVIDKIL